MKKVISLTLGSVLVLLLVSLAYAQDDPTVYVTKSGSKYHNAGCSSLKKSAIPMKLSEVGDRYSPCSRCNPPIANANAKVGEQSKKNVSTSPKKSEVAPSPAPKRSGETEVGTTPTGKTIYEGPRGGRYHYSKSGKKVYERKKR
jgi:hypothetical protein